MTVKSEEIRSLLSFFEKSGWEELRIETGGVKIAVSKTGSLAIRGAAAPTAAATPPVADAPRIASPAAHPAARSPTPAGSALAPGQVYLRAPNLGVVWSLPKPGAPAFVVEGQLIEEGATVCVIEVMKLFTQVVSNVRGKVVRRLVADGEMVEHDTPLFIIEAA